MLRIENLSVAFGENKVLHQISFDLDKGESLGIVGESGSGKSITALALMGLLPPGARIVDGRAILKNHLNGKAEDLFKISEKEHRFIRGKKIGMVFQEPMTSLNPSMRCGKQVMEAVCLHQAVSEKDARSICYKLFSEMQLQNPQKVYKSYPHELSGGQKQRVMIAIALAGNPDILIADEPTTALDVTVQKEILQLIKSLIQKREMSLIFISHDLGVISRISNRLIVLKDGYIVEEGETKEIFRKPKHPYTHGLIACKPPVNSRPIKLHTVQDFMAGNLSELPDREIINPEKRDVENKKIYSQKPLISVENASVEYTLKRNFVGKPTNIFTAVNSVSFHLYPGETLGLVGESGCGKTSLGRAILGLTNLKSGRISYNGETFQQMNSSKRIAFRRDVQLVFQDPYSSLNPRHTIGEAIMEPMQVHNLVSSSKIKKKRAEELLEMVSLPTDSFYRYPHEFSGGQRQRIAIARALALNPKVIICDEMVSALDVSVQAQILNLLNNLKAELGLTYLFISHDLSVVKYMSNRVLVMRQGKAEEYGDSDLVFSNPASDYTKRLIESIP